MGCKVCKAARLKTRFGRCEGAIRLDNLMRHGNHYEDQRAALANSDTGASRAAGVNRPHQKAISRWNSKIMQKDDGDRMREQPLATRGGASDSASTAAGLHGVITFSHLVVQRTLLRAGGSFRDFNRFAKSAALTGTAELCKGGDRRVSRQLCDTFAKLERQVTFQFLSEGSVFRLAADGRQAMYQVQIGTLLWKWPRGLGHLRPGDSAASLPEWLEQLGEGSKGPWLVERVIGAREFDRKQDTPAKVSMLDECVRQAAIDENDEFQSDQHRRWCEGTRFWASDGADRTAGLAATSNFPNMAFQLWDESHSASLVLKHAMAQDEEVKKVDELLVSGKDPQSLAKFVSTSDVFRGTFKQSQVEETVAVLKNFCWAPQRLASRSRPYGRISRRLWAVLKSVAIEADGSTKRAQNARYLLRELGGQHSSRLLLGGMLAELSAEHFKWIAESQAKSPDPSTSSERTKAFLNRLQVLFEEGLVVTDAM